MPHLLSLIFILTFNALAATNTPNSIAALVNDTVLTFSAINNKIKPNATKAEKRAIIEREIDLILQLAKIRALGIKPKPKMVNTALGQIAKKNALTLTQLRSMNEFDDIMQEIIQQLSLIGLKQLTLQKADIQLTDAEIQAIPNKNPNAATQQIKISRIVINSIDQTDNLVQSQDTLIKQFLTKLSTEIKQGASFSSMAKLHSQGPSYKNGGVSKWLDKQKMLSLLPPLSKLKTHELSRPFKTQYGWMIVKIIDERSIDTQYMALKQQKLRAKRDNYYQKWVKTLRENAYIEVFDHKL